MANDDLQEQPTRKFTPFETMVMARFDDLTVWLTRFQHDTNERLDALTSSQQDTNERLARFQHETNERLDALTIFQHETNERLEKLESRALDTKPIWERALAEILNVKAEVVEIKDRLHNVERDLLQVRADLRGFDRRITALENP